MADITMLKQAVERALGECKEAADSNARFAFWHDVGVTGLSALSTVLIGIGEMATRHSATGLRVAVLFLTGSVTVFSACAQFLKFKDAAAGQRAAVRSLLLLQRRIERAAAAPSDEVLVRLSDEFDTILQAVEPIEAVEGKVWPTPEGRSRALAVLTIVLVGLFVGMEIVIYVNGRTLNGADSLVAGPR